MNLYENRLKSFEFWYGKESKERLASLGFYYSGRGDRVVCAFCKFDLYNFSERTDALHDHKRFSPHCPFVFEQCRVSNYMNTTFLPPRIIKSNYHPHLQLDTMHYNDYSLLEHRSNTYFNFPKCLRSLQHELCRAGFYYTNVGDCVCCYACGVVVNDWRETQDPLARHASTNPACPLVRGFAGDTAAARINDTQNAVLEREVSTTTASAPPFHTVHYTPSHYQIPKCLTCRASEIACVLLPCYHFCLCAQCAPVALECPACHVSCTGVFVVKIPKRQLDVIDSEDGARGGV